MSERWKLVQDWCGAVPDGIPGEQTATAILAKIGLLDKPTTRLLTMPEAFYAGVRKVTGSLDQVQVETINGLLAGAAHWSTGWLAYGLATAWHEARLKPVEEIGKGRGHPYGQPGKYAQAQYGRGLVQLTWDKNYEWVDKALGLNGALLKDFSLALRPDIASKVLILGMETGAFTGRKLADYIKDRGTLPAFTEARRIINGTDRAGLVAGYAVGFQDALDLGGWQ